jgi:hypothetical protein
VLIVRVMKSCVFWEIKPSSLLITDVSEEHGVFIRRVEEQAKQETGVKQAASAACSAWCFPLYSLFRREPL